MLDKLTEILSETKMERYAYLAMCIVSFLVLISVGLIGVLKDDVKIPVFIAMFGSTGVVGICLGRVLRVWTDCITLLQTVAKRAMR